MDDETRLSDGDDATRMVSSESGWLTSTGSIDHGRFQPGEVLQGRYRILGLLGRGGMGEVYRADDLRLGQQVALKFLPPVLGQDPVRLAQFHNEVRTARQVSHPNVCRVYDIGEFRPDASKQPQLFITMEYVDGEDLSALLKRIGRFPEDKAVEIARQVCAGLAAAHDKGILHRDLKPANIMLDSAGRVRLMDFSLASVGAVADVRAGTPAYMAPEQLHGREVTIRSDIFALGLVLYELFTGRRRFNARTIGELVEQHEQAVTTTLSEVAKHVDPAVDRVVARCLDPEPARRPASAMAVAAQLSADPLAAALAAGETPSPEMIAAVGGVAASVSARAGALMLAAIAVLLIAGAGLTDRTAMVARLPLSLPVEVLVDRAQQIRTTLGYTEPFADDAFNFRYDSDYLAWAATQSGDPWASLPSGRPAAIRFWYRTSPQLLIPFDDNFRPGIGDPPTLVSGMVTMEVDTTGRLQSFVGVPPQVERPLDGPAPVVEWSEVFGAAGLELGAFADTRPEWTPRSFADERRAWIGEWAELPGHSIRIEAAAYRGRVTMFEQVAPWTRATREVPYQPTVIPWLAWVGGLIIFVLPIGAAWMAWRNARDGRGDIRGALKTGGFVTALTLSTWIASPFHLPAIEIEINRFFLAVGFSMFNGGLLFAVYLAVEPIVRRVWPSVLITWSRVTTGRWRRDPLLGRDLMVGVLIGAALTVAGRLYSLLPGALGWAPPPPDWLELSSLLGVQDWYISVANRVLWALQNAMIGALVLALVRRFVSATWVVVLIVAVIFTIVSNRTGSVSTYVWLDLAISVVLSLGLVLTLVRWGLLAAIVTFFAYLTTSALLTTAEASRLYFASSAWLLAVLVGLGVIGYRWARADEPILGARKGFG